MGWFLSFFFLSPIINTLTDHRRSRWCFFYHIPYGRFLFFQVPRTVGISTPTTTTAPIYVGQSISCVSRKKSFFVLCFFNFKKCGYRPGKKIHTTRRARAIDHSIFFQGKLCCVTPTAIMSVSPSTISVFVQRDRDDVTARVITNVETRETSFGCRRCRRSFSFRGALVEHMNRFHILRI